MNDLLTTENMSIIVTLFLLYNERSSDFIVTHVLI